MMQLNVTPDFKKRSLKFKPEFPAAAKLESVELVIPNPDGEIKTAGLSFIIYSARCGSRKLAVCDAFTGTGTITGTLNLCTDRMVDEFYHLPLGTRRSFHAVLWSEADQWMIGAGRISIVNNPGSDSLNPAPLPADRYPTFEEVEEMIRNSGGLDEPVVRRVNGIAPDNAGNVSITIPGDVSELKDKDGLTLTVQQKNTLATLSTTYAAKNHTHSEYALKSELPDVSGFITADKLNLYQLKADAFSGKYADLAGKPSAFPPASHTHAVADVNGLADELSRKLTVPAGGNAGQVIGKTSDGYGWITVSGGVSSWNDLTDKPSAFPPSAHNHAITDVTGLEDALQNAGSVKSVNGQLPDESGNVTVETGGVVDESRLLPTGGRNGNLLEYQEGADRGNNVNTKLLLQPATSDGLIVDQAAGNAAPVGITNSGNVAIAANALVFSGENALIIEPNTLGMTLGGNNEYSIEVDFQLDQVKSDWATLFGGDGSMTRSAFYINSSGATAVQGGIAPDTTGWTTGTRHRLTIERFQDGDSWKTVIYRNGAVLATSVTTPNTLSGDRFPIGSNLEGTGRNFVGKIWAFRISNKAEHRGVSFTPRELPFLPPAGQPVWTEGIDRSRLLPENPANGDIPCFDATATVGGGNDANTKILLHFDADEIKDEAAGNASPAPAAKKAGTITIVDGGKFDKCAQFVTGSMTVATNLYELNANNWVVSGWFNPDENNHGVSYPVWLSMDDSSTNGFFFDSTGRYGESDGPLFYMDTPPASGTWHWLAIVNYSGGLRFYLNGAFLNEISAQQRANFCSMLAIGGFAGTYAVGSTERTFSGLVDEVRLQYIPDDEITQWTGTNIAVPDAPYSKPQTVGKWGKLNKAKLVQSVNGQTPDSSGAVTIPAATVSAAGLMAAADKVKLDALQQAATYINTATDFDTYKTAGSYFLKGAVHTNGPLTDSYAGTLVVVALAEPQYATQYFTQLYTNKTFVRTYAQDNSAWSAWRRIIVDTDITESKARPGYFKLPGGTIVQWGAVSNVTADGNTQITFPVAFPNAFLIGNATAVSGNASASGVVVSLTSVTVTGMTLIIKNHPGNSNDINVHWLAIGY